MFSHYHYQKCRREPARRRGPNNAHKCVEPSLEKHPNIGNQDFLHPIPNEGYSYGIIWGVPKMVVTTHMDAYFLPRNFLWIHWTHFDGCQLKKAQNPCHCLKPAANRSSRTVRTWAQKQVLLVLSSHRQRCWVPCHSNASHQPADASACTTWWRKLWIRGIDNNNFSETVETWSSCSIHVNAISFMYLRQCVCVDIRRFKSLNKHKHTHIY